MKIRAFITQHKAEKISECQDRFAVNQEARIVAVSDGVSQSIFPDIWADLLVKHYTKTGRLSNEDRIGLCNQWKSSVLKFIDNEKAHGNNPWRAESNLAEGISAGATLCGLRFNGKFHWICDVLGDSCLIKYNADKSIEIISSEEKAFDTYPDYLDSNPIKKGRGEFRRFEGELSKGDRLLLVSDPFSDYFYNLKEESQCYLNELLSISSHEEYIDLVSRWREQGMHNDDSTAVIIEWDDSSEFHMSYIDDIEDLIECENQNAAVQNLVQEEQTTQDNVPLDDNITSHPNEIDERKKKEQYDSEVELKKKYYTDQIPFFLDDFIKKEEIIQHTHFKNIIRYVFESKKKRVNELRALLDFALTEYVKSLKC